MHIQPSGTTMEFVFFSGNSHWWKLISPLSHYSDRLWLRLVQNSGLYLRKSFLQLLPIQPQVFRNSSHGINLRILWKKRKLLCWRLRGTYVPTQMHLATFSNGEKSLVKWTRQIHPVFSSIFFSSKDGEKLLTYKLCLDIRIFCLLPTKFQLDIAKKLMVEPSQKLEFKFQPKVMAIDYNYRLLYAKVYEQ